MNKKNDLVTLVDEHDQVVGSMDKVEAHRGEGRLHRAISVFLFRKNKTDGRVELLIQQRSSKKIVGAGQWANTVCGNVWPDEDYEMCARRRLSDELGIGEMIELKDLSTFRYQVRCNNEFSENEIDHIFVGWFDGEVSPNPAEVAATEWVKWQDVKGIKKDWAPWFALFLEDITVMNLMENYARN